MLTSKARRRLALKTSAFALLGAGVFGVIPAVAALATPTTVTYNCGTGTAVAFTMEMSTPALATPSGPATVNWQIRQPSSGGLTAAASISANSTIVAEATVTPSGSPIPSTTVTVSGAATPLTAISAGASMPIPTMPIVVTPTATGTVVIKGDAFALKVNGSPVVTCTPSAAGGGPSVNLVVATGAATSTSTSTSTSTNTPTATPTNTPTTHTPKPTTTRTKFVTESPTKKTSKTPKAGADTGGGGGVGPDGRMIMLVGSLLILGAGAGGLVLRRRTVSKG